MERVSAHTVTATTFCLHSSAMKSRVHFFPSAGVTTGPYSITCTFTLFGKGVEKRSVSVDGGRLGQPDGIRLEDAFPALRGDASGVFGLTLELSCQQQRVNMLSSQAAIEVVSPQFSVLYGLPRFSAVLDSSEESEDELDVRRPSQAAAILDAFVTTSLVVINPSKRVLKPSIFRQSSGERIPLHLGTVAAESAVEIPLEDAILKESSPHECTWGLTRGEVLYFGDPTYSDVVPAGNSAPLSVEGVAQTLAGAPNPVEIGARPSYFLLYRDPVSKRPTSASAL